MTTKPLTVLFMPESAYGPTNNCIGIGDVLRRRGHRVIFAAEASWKDRLTPYGFEETLVDLAPPSDGPADAGQFWKDFVRNSAPEFRRPTIEQLTGFMVPTWQALIDGSRFCHPQLRGILDAVRPDIVVEDNVVSFPALLTAGVPYVRIVSCNPLEVPGTAVPPAYSGLPSDDSSQWVEFREEHARTHRALWAEFDAWVQEEGAPPLPELEFVHTSTDLNLYVYPEVIDYVARRPLDATWHRLDSSVRRTEDSVDVRGEWLTRREGSALIYLSLGSLGSADVDLMKRIVHVLAETPHRYIVSTGPRHAEYELAPNMWGAEFLPQTQVLPLVDLVITHGGNNTITESFHFGKPTVVLPIFWDQHDNAQRVSETGFGVRVRTYSFTDSELRGAIEGVLADSALRSRVAVTGERIRGRDGLTAAAGHIEALAWRK
ncbi:MAG TPA: nucleotide disphospho-sugar-binding domain-containing protein [Candidatus Deferrimicrobium sp.]|nr:nucleotide disphospho-sugar-binding domain-containing protein [Candidatus Deferrimicrobium sp.]